MDNTLRKLQLIQLDMLKLVDRICRDNNICYSLYAGTLLGAVRHKGFIPWDDDLDICMRREEYNRFLSIWDSTEHYGYVLQNKENTPTFTQSFTKVRKEHTAFVQTEWEAGLYHNGIFIDIFPIDRIPNGWLERILFRWYCIVYQLYTREFIPPNSNPIVKAGSSLMLLFTSKSRRVQRRKKLLKKITSYNSNSKLHTIAIQTTVSIQHPYLPEMMDNYIDLPFEDGLFMCSAEWDAMLTEHYGNYLVLPPKEKQTWFHHPVFLDFEHEFAEQKESG